jgi:DNA mismatch repair ATPase MutS
MKNNCHALKIFSITSFITMSMGESSSNPLDVLMDYVRMTLHIDLMKFNQMLNEIQGKKEIVDSLVTTMGFIESMIVIANYRKALSIYTVPIFGEHIEFQDVYHPLIENAISNNIEIANSILLTGSNASGKSTFLKMLCVNCILAQTIHTCTSKKANVRLQYIYSSMKLEDSIEKGESYYMAEIRGIKRMLDVSENNKKVICFVDEVLRGTNTVERIAASMQILKALASYEAICIAATHDVELTTLLKNTYENYHFTEEIQKEDIFFSYKIQKGPAMTRNAILLLENMGYPKELVEVAKKTASNFMATGNWEVNE